MLAFSLSIFLSAFLLFIIQPTVAKLLLPFFGGSPSVWLSNIVFYQTALLLGYAYAYFITKVPKLSWQALCHIALLALSLIFLPITPAKTLASLPVWQPLVVFAVLGATLFFPVMIMSATSPLLQYWYYHSYHSDFPYRYYALSNFGSLLGLFTFPLLLEPWVGLKLQLKWWSIAYVFFFISCTICALITFKHNHHLDHKKQTTIPIKKIALFSWLLLTALSSALLLTTTQVMMQNVIGMPLLWVIPLALYLISFILVFYHPIWYVRPLWMVIFIAFAALIFYLPSHHQLTLFFQVIAYSFLLFSGCMICHGEIYRLQPDKQHLTFYYLMIALGSVIGGFFVNLISPLLFNDWWDFYATVLLILFYVGCIAFFQEKRMKLLWQKCLFLAWMASFVGLCYVLMLNFQEARKDVIFVHRNFFGKFEVAERNIGDKNHMRLLRNGNILHGQQYLSPTLRNMSTTYYSKASGISLAFEFERFKKVNAAQGLRIGAIGLGSGTIAALAHKGDLVRFYEIDPDIEKVAKDYFYYLKDSPATVEVIIGDGRLVLAKEFESTGSMQYDIIAVDAFNGDAIPLHLLTKEAFNIYLSHLKEGGILAFHISSRYVDLYPPLQALSKAFGLHAYLTHQKPENDYWITRSEWLLISRQPNIGLFVYQKGASAFRDRRIDDVWTDDYNYLLPIMNW